MSRIAVIPLNPIVPGAPVTVSVPVRTHLTARLDVDFRRVASALCR